MCKALSSILEGLFSKNKALAEVNVNDNSNTNKKIKKQKQVIDNSVDKSNTVVGGNQYNNSSENNYYGNNNSKDLVISARWLHLVPHKIEKVVNGIDCFNVLKPVDKNYIPPILTVDFDNTNNISGGIYVLVRNNDFLKNLKIKQVIAHIKNCDIQYDDIRNVFGLLEKPKAFSILGKDFSVGSGEIALKFGFELDKKHYVQEFNFLVTNDSNEFVLQEYKEPELDIDWANFSF